MKYLVLILFAFAALTAAQEKDPYSMTRNLARSFRISEKEARNCVDKEALTPDDLWILHDTSFDDMNLNNKTMRRVICALTCCAQAQGTLIGAKPQLPVIHELIQTADMPQHLKRKFHKYVEECAEIVKDYTDECEVTLEYSKCISNKI